MMWGMPSTITNFTNRLTRFRTDLWPCVNGVERLSRQRVPWNRMVLSAVPPSDASSGVKKREGLNYWCTSKFSGEAQARARTRASIHWYLSPTPLWIARILKEAMNTASAFVGHGKKTAWATWNSLQELNGAQLLTLRSACTHWNPRSMQAIERFVILIYDQTSTCTDIDKARKKLFTKKSSVLPHELLLSSMSKELPSKVVTSGANTSPTA